MALAHQMSTNHSAVAHWWGCLAQLGCGEHDTDGQQPDVLSMGGWAAGRREWIVGEMGEA